MSEKSFSLAMAMVIPKGPKGDKGDPGDVESVNSKTGAVTLDAGDLAFDSSETYDSGTIGAELSEVKSEITQVEDKYLSGVNVPKLRNGTIGNPGNVNGVTTEYIMPLNLECDYMLAEYLGTMSDADNMGFYYCFYKNATDGMTTTQAMQSGSVTKYNVNDNWTKSSPQPYLIIPMVDSIAAYDHISIGAFKRIGNDAVPIRIATQQGCLRITYGRYNKTNPAVSGMMPGVGYAPTGAYLSTGGGWGIPNNRILFDRIPVKAGDVFLYDVTKLHTTMRVQFAIDIYPSLTSNTMTATSGWSENGYYVCAASGFALIRLKPLNNSLAFAAVTDWGNSLWFIPKSDVDEPANELANARHIKGNTGTPLTILHFSDIHGDAVALNRIVSAKDKYVSVDDMICTGDMSAEGGGSISSWWNKNVMTCVGNHDSATYSSGSYNWTAVTMANRDAYYIAPFESNWSVTHTSGTSYYYKDYATQKVRLIVMDGMLYMGTPGAEATAQTTWLSGLLSDAITNSMHVLIAIHAPHGGSEVEECSFSRVDQTAMPTYTDANTPQDVIDAVATAITGGLKFIGYLCGHTHQDNVWDAEDDDTQHMFCVTCANNKDSVTWENSDMDRSRLQDAYNLVTIDTTNTLVKIVRGGGSDIDDHMRTRKAICFDYSTGTKVGEVL